MNHLPNLCFTKADLPLSILLVVPFLCQEAYDQGLVVKVLHLVLKVHHISFGVLILLVHAHDHLVLESDLVLLEVLKVSFHLRGSLQKRFCENRHEGLDFVHAIVTFECLTNISLEMALTTAPLDLFGPLIGAHIMIWYLLL